MTKNSDLKSSVRSLAALTGLPYQKCHQAVEVLRAVPHGVSLGDLDNIVNGSGARNVAVLTLPYVADFSTLFEPPVEPIPDASDVVIFAGQTPLMLVQLDGSRWGLPTSAAASIWYEVYLDEGELRPTGIWRTSAGRLRSAVAGANDDEVTLLVEPLSSPGAFPELFVDGRRPRTAYINNKLAKVSPAHTEPGPGFSWVHVPFVDIDMVPGAEGEDHRLGGCDQDGTCGWLHDWPTADPTHTRMTLPAPLLDVFQKLFDHEKGLFSTEEAYMNEYTDDGCDWYGLDLPNLSTIWMRVDTDGVDPTS